MKEGDSPSRPGRAVSSRTRRGDAALGRSYTTGLILLSEPYATPFLDRCQWQVPFSPDIIIIETHTGESCLISFRYYDQIGRLAR